MVVFSQAALSLRAADYHVGDGQPYATIGAVAWHTLVPGDTVWIHTVNDDGTSIETASAGFANEAGH